MTQAMLARWLQEMRKARGETQVEAALAIGCPYSTLARVEGGYGPIPPRWLEAFAGHFGVAPGELIASKEQAA